MAQRRSVQDPSCNSAARRRCFGPLWRLASPCRRGVGHRLFLRFLGPAKRLLAALSPSWLPWRCFSSSLSPALRLLHQSRPLPLPASSVRLSASRWRYRRPLFRNSLARPAFSGPLQGYELPPGSTLGRSDGGIPAPPMGDGLGTSSMPRSVSSPRLHGGGSISRAWRYYRYSASFLTHLLPSAKRLVFSSRLSIAVIWVSRSVRTPMRFLVSVTPRVQT